MSGPPVPPMQILLRGVNRATAEVDLVANPTGTDPDTFEDLPHGVRVPRLGGKSLARLADLAREHGFRILRYELLSSQGRLITDETTESELSRQLLDAEEAGGSTAVLGLMAHDLLDWEISGVELFSPAAGTLTVRRNGVVFTRNPHNAEQLLRETWPAVVA